MENFESIRKSYPVVNNGAYLMNAAIGGIHIETHKEIEHYSKESLFKGAIGDIRFFELLEEARETAGSFIGLSKEEVAFSGSTSLNMNFLAIMLKKSGVKKIVAPSVEFPSSTIPWFHQGFEVELVEPRQGRIWEEDLISKACPNSAVVCSGVQFLTGQRMNLVQIGEELASKSIPFIINGTQQIGQFPLELKDIKFTAFSASLHKWLGADLGLSLLAMPNNEREKYCMPIAGWVSVEDPWKLSNEAPKFLKDMGAFQMGTIPFNLVAGAKKAMEIQLSIGISNIEERVLFLSQKLITEIKELGYSLLSPRENSHERSGICTFEYSDDLDSALTELEKKNVYVNGRRGAIRASIHFYNNEADIELFKRALASI
ncbi:MAG: hypothetical protein CME70_14720 [Halobacteriovorax sp.]|nr:hypothetical protein [Halobacteriovorax sp.]|tara:strand:+ start:186773 stop:187891 length:1119 start_codon:yes stop_codon:yes gene_type:complete